jgi:hypothetical protein
LYFTETKTQLLYFRTIVDGEYKSKSGKKQKKDTLKTMHGNQRSVVRHVAEQQQQQTT